MTFEIHRYYTSAVCVFLQVGWLQNNGDVAGVIILSSAEIPSSNNEKRLPVNRCTFTEVIVK